MWTALGGVQQWVPWDRMQREITFKHWNSKCSVKHLLIFSSLCFGSKQGHDWSHLKKIPLENRSGERQLASLRRHMINLKEETIFTTQDSTILIF